MKNKLLFLFPLLILAACSQPGKLTVGPLSLSTSAPRQGEKISIQYQADSSKLAGSNALESTLYYAVKNKIYAAAVSLADSGDLWKGSFTLPDTAQAFALKFTAGDQSDNNNGNDYIFPVYDRSGKPLPGALAAESRFYVGLGEYLLGNSKANWDTTAALLKNDITAHPGIKKDWQYNYLLALIYAKGKPAFPKIQDQVQQMLAGKNIEEEDYMHALNLYAQMRMTHQDDSLKKIIRQKYPDGQQVQNDLARAFSQQKDVDSMVMLYNQFKEDFPTNDPKGVTANIKSSMILRIANAYSAKKQYDKVMQYASQSNNKSMLANMYNGIAWPLAQKGDNLSFADSLSKASLDLLQQQIDNPGKSKPGYYTTADWKRMQQAAYGNDADTYALILAKEGKYKEALQYQKKAVDYTKGKTPDINERYAGYLVKTGDYATAQKELEQFFASGKSTPKMQEYLKTAYTKQKGSDAGYADYLAGLEAKATAKIKEGLAKKMIDKPAAGFTLPGLDGSNVSLAALKGKVVIVDFWATWCGPCKASFPGMQKAVTQFKDDSNVVFLFVDTWEHTKPAVRHQQVSDFIQQHKYSFHVLLDQPQKKDSTQFQVVSAYGVSGIPTKFIIDPAGHVRFKLVGFDGNTDNEVKEIKMMINMLKS